MGGSPRGGHVPPRRPPEGGVLIRFPLSRRLTHHSIGAPLVVVPRVVCLAAGALVLVVVVVSIRCSLLLLPHLGVGVTGSGDARSRVGGFIAPQPSTAYGELLREQGLLKRPDNPTAPPAHAECASSHPSITEYLLRGYRLPGLNVDNADPEDDSLEENGNVEANGETRKSASNRRGGGGFVYHRESEAGDVEGVRRDPEPKHGSCAVVGSSRTLLSAQYGGEIDACDAVVRFGDAPTRGFENVLGRRTTYRVASAAFAASVAAGSPNAVKTIAGAPRMVPGAKALVVGEEVSGQQQRDIQEKVPSLLLYPVVLGVTEKVKGLYKDFAKKLAALEAGTAGESVSKLAGGVANLAKEVPVALLGVFFAMHTCEEVHVYGFEPPGAERHVANQDYYSGHGAHGAEGSGGGSGGKGSGLSRGSDAKGAGYRYGVGGKGVPAAGIGDEVTRLIIRALALEGYVQNHP